ncbi:hypothetical protein F9C07_11577 [Aspergillus flavus]|uniref:Uncharacterized protein n=1 Tax=Aspergillus flavus (strain ATCC 200026 / FGSC A1120 / IAM 13836 / NRRL 3357 / JCM 12722 / SRRC 167) TaxID=332952 RepID=A0A7U2N373_ASPFN|nr:hypothetical protein F9C07_11577 [Aspergillus flavus]
MTGMSPSFSSDVIYSGLVPAFGKSWWDHETVHVTMAFAGFGSLLLVNGHARARVPEALDEFIQPAPTSAFHSSYTLSKTIHRQQQRQQNQ